MTRRSAPTRLYKDPQNGRIMGVCAGVADYLGMRRCIVRILTVVAMFMLFFWPIFIGYFIMGFVLESKPEDLYEDDEEEDFWRDVRTRPDYTAVDLRERFREIERRTRNMEAYMTSKEFRLKRQLKELED